MTAAEKKAQEKLILSLLNEFGSQMQESPYKLVKPAGEIPFIVTDKGPKGNPIGGKMVLVTIAGQEFRVGMHRSTNDAWGDILPGEKILIGLFEAEKSATFNINGKTVTVEAGTKRVKAYVDELVA